MKKGLVFITALAALGLGLAACNGGGSSGGKTYTVTITNKDALAEIVEDDTTKSVSVTISDVITADAYLSGDLVVTSQNESVLQIKGNNKILPVAAGETTIKATYKNKFSDSVNVKIVPQQALQIITDPQEGEDYILSMTPANGKVNYAVGGMDGYYLKSGIDMSKAATATVDINEDATDDYKYSIKLTYTVNEAEVTKTIGGYRSGTHTNIGYVEDATSSAPFETSWFKLNDDYSFSTIISGTEYWIGTYSTYTTFSYRDASQIAYKAHLFGMKDAIHSTAVSINEEDVTVKVGGVTKLTASLTPENSTDTVTWSSNNKAVATVDINTGVVVGVSEGTAVITAQSWVGITDTVEVTVSGAVNYGSESEPLTVQQAKAMLNEEFPDGTITPKELYVTGTVSSATYSDKYSNWEIWLYDGETAKGFELYATLADTGVDTTKFIDGAVVKAYGLAKIHNAGQASAVYELTNSGSVSNPHVYEVSYTAPDLEGIVVTPETATVDILNGATTKQFSVAPNPAAAAFESSEVSWSVSPAGAGVTVSSSGLVSVAADAVEEDASAEFTITASYTVNEATLTDSAVLTVTRDTSGGGQVEPDVKISDLKSGDTVTDLKATVMAVGSDNKNFFIDDGYAGILAYASAATSGISAGDCVTVSGTVSAYNNALQIGSAVLTKSSETAPTPTSVTELTEAKAAELFALGTSANTPIGGRYSLRTDAIGGSGTYLTWNYGSTPMETGAKVTANMQTGKVYDLVGYIAGNYKGQYLLFVPTSATEVAVSLTGLELSSEALSIKPGESKTLTVSALPAGAALPEELNWSSSNEAVATVADGVVTVKSDATVGATATITVSGGGFSDTCVVTVLDSSAATEQTVTKNISEISGTTADGTKVSNMTMDSVISLAASTSGNNGKVYSSGAQWRFYQGDSGTLTVSANNATIVSVTITFTVTNTGDLLYNSNSVTSGTAVSVNAASALFTLGNTGSATNGQVRITAISVTYLA